MKKILSTILYDAVVVVIMLFFSWRFSYPQTVVTFYPTMTTEQIQQLIDEQPRYQPYWTDLTFQFSDGYYGELIDKRLVWDGFYGGGIVFIQGNPNEGTGVLHTDQAVTLDFTGANDHGLIISGCCLQSVVIRNLKIKVKTDGTSNNVAVYNEASQLTQLTGCFLQGTGTAGGYGILTMGGQMDVRSNYWSNFANAIYANNAVTIYSFNNRSTGTLPKYGLRALNASTIGKGGMQPDGSTQDEYAANGGEIRGQVAGLSVKEIKQLIFKCLRSVGLLR